MARKKKHTYHLKKRSLYESLMFFKEKFYQFKIIKTGHTYKVDTGMESYFFSDGATSKRVFITQKELEREITPSLELIEAIDSEKIQYYHFNESFKEKEIDCVDISSAYANAMRNLGYISEKSFKKLNSLKKSDRLKVVGMFATKKAIYEVQAGKLISADTVRKDTEKVFFSLCHEIGQLMNSIILKYGNKIGFFWVDGIFCSKDVSAEIMEFIISQGYPCKIEPVKNVRKSKNGNFVFYDKMEKEKWKPKFLPIPRKRQVNDENVIRFLESWK